MGDRARRSRGNRIHRRVCLWPRQLTPPRPHFAPNVLLAVCWLLLPPLLVDPAIPKAVWKRFELFASIATGVLLGAVAVKSGPWIALLGVIAASLSVFAGERIGRDAKKEDAGQHPNDALGEVEGHGSDDDDKREK